jgi:acetyltransferase-like isoleucine patch superfamily enzyme
VKDAGQMTEEQKKYNEKSAMSELDSLEHGGGAIKKYMKLAVGSESFFDLFRYELFTGLLSPFPGALGYLLRQKLYRQMMGKMGRGVAIGKNITIRGPKKIFIGKNVLLEDYCHLDARGANSQIIIGDNVIVARSTIIRSRNGQIAIGDGTSIGTNCIIATDAGLSIGKDVLIAAYCYLSGGGSHNYDDTSIPIIKQDFTSKGGIIVGDGAWLGTQTVVLDGVKIGDGAIVGAKSLVNKEMPAMSISFGTPAKVVRMRGE